MSRQKSNASAPAGATLAMVAKHAADICRHTAAWLAGEAGTTDRAIRRRIVTCARDIIDLLGEEPQAPAGATPTTYGERMTARLAWLEHQRDCGEVPDYSEVLEWLMECIDALRVEVDMREEPQP